MRGHPATLTIAGETRTVATWARISGICYNTLYYRLRKGILPEAAVFAGRYDARARVEHGGVDLPVYRPRAKRRKRVSFPVTLTTWGGFSSINFPRVSA